MKRTLATLLVLIMLLTLCAACQKTDTTPGDTTANTPATTTDTPATTTDTPSDSSDSNVETPIDEVPDQYKSVADVWSGITLSESPYGFNYDLNYNGRTDKTDKYLHGAGSWPICDWGEKELSLWLPASDSVLKYVATGDEYSKTNFLWGMTQERTGVKVDIELTSSTTAAQKFPLIIASGEYPDIMTNVTSYYSGGLAKALEDEVIADLTDYMDENMPNYLHWLNMTPSNLKEGKQDNGAIAMIYSITMQVQPPFPGYMYRQDWADKAGLGTPETIDDWHTMLTAFKEYSTGEPMDFATWGADSANYFTGAFNVHVGMNFTSFFRQKDGVVEATINTDEYRQYLATMAQWFSEGLIDTDFISTPLMSAEHVTKNEAGAICSAFTVAGDFYAKLGADPEAFFVCAPYPTLDGTERHIYYKGTTANALASGGVSLSTQLSEEDLKVAMRMLDWQFTEEGTIAGQYGKEGESFTFDENGHPFQTTMITANENGESSSTNQDLYMCNNTFGGKLIERETDVCDEPKKAHLTVWNSYGDWNMEGTLSYTPAEAEERAGLMSDISTYMGEFACKVINGTYTLDDATWNEYLKTLDGYKLSRIIEITQDAYTRYLAR